MSIIHEALKKVQSNRSITKSPPITSGPIVPTPPTMTPSRTRTVIPLGFILWGVVIVGVSFVTGYNVFELMTRKTPAVISPPPKTEGAVVILPPQPVATPSAVAKPAVKKNDIVLTGIVLMDGKKFALINNQFYEKGETVAGVAYAKILQITDDSIEIQQKGKTRTIKVIRPD